MTTRLMAAVMFFIATFSFAQTFTVHYKTFNQVEHPVALLVLFNGAPGFAAGIQEETNIPLEATSQKIQCIGIDQTELFLADTTYTRIKNTIALCMQHYHLPEGRLFLGGFSLGGYTAVRFAELAKEKSDLMVLPLAVFGVDPLLDHFAAWNYAQKEAARDCANEGSQKYGKPEAEWLKQYYQTNFGSPIQDSLVYIQRSCYSPALKGGGNAKFLLNMPIRLYHEIDLMWYARERCRDITDENIIVGSQLINYLYNHGNKDVVIVVTENKGKRADGRKHPHSWSIADPKETVEWLMKFIQQ